MGPKFVGQGAGKGNKISRRFSEELFAERAEGWTDEADALDAKAVKEIIAREGETSECAVVQRGAHAKLLRLGTRALKLAKALGHGNEDKLEECVPVWIDNGDKKIFLDKSDFSAIIQVAASAEAEDVKSHSAKEGLSSKHEVASLLAKRTEGEAKAHGRSDASATEKMMREWGYLVPGSGKVEVRYAVACVVPHTSMFGDVHCLCVSRTHEA